MSLMASQITSLTIVYSAVYSGADQRKLQSSASLAFVRWIHRGSANSPHKRPVTRKMFPFDDVIMNVKLFKVRFTHDVSMPWRRFPYYWFLCWSGRRSTSHQCIFLTKALKSDALMGFFCLFFWWGWEGGVDGGWWWWGWWWCQNKVLNQQSTHVTALWWQFFILEIKKGGFSCHVNHTKTLRSRQGCRQLNIFKAISLMKIKVFRNGVHWSLLLRLD